jgi:NADH-quinone oxidoreductase subunit E
MSGNKVHHPLFVRENRPVVFSESALEKIRQLVKRYPAGQQKSALLPVLHIAQQENGGYLTVDAMDQVAELLSLQPIEVYEVATFYHMYFLGKVGKYVIEVCHTAPCAVCGGEELMEHLEKRLGIRNGDTTADGLFTLRGVECLGGCGYAPVLQVNTAFHEYMTKENVERLIDELREEHSRGINRETKWEEEFC